MVDNGYNFQLRDWRNNGSAKGGGSDMQLPPSCTAPAPSSADCPQPGNQTAGGVASNPIPADPNFSRAPVAIFIRRTTSCTIISIASGRWPQLSHS